MVAVIDCSSRRLETTKQHPRKRKMAVADTEQQLCAFKLLRKKPGKIDSLQDKQILTNCFQCTFRILMFDLPYGFVCIRCVNFSYTNLNHINILPGPFFL